MNCNQIRIQISAFVDQGLEEETRGVREHLDSCGSCQEFYQEQLQLQEWVEDLSRLEAEPPLRIWNQIRSEIQAPADQPGFEIGRWFLDLVSPGKLGYATMALAVLILVSIALVNTIGIPAQNQQILTELRAYSLEVEGNPFLPAVDQANPFLPLSRPADENPFRTGNLQ